MLTSLRTPLRRIVEPIAAALLRIGLSPDAVTVAGTVGVVLAALLLVTRGYLLAALVVITVLSLTDLLDGTMARLSARTSRWGAFLDSTLDRVSDSAAFGSLAWWLGTQDRPGTAAAALCCLVGGFLTSYAKARAEGLGMTADVGVAERTDRLVVLGVGGLLEIVGVPYGLLVVLWLLAGLSVITVGQRLYAVRVQARAAEMHQDAAA
jgi:CDP-diacylglycerol--glycerol-3-phosphate 3-phosphatidyltransferase